MGSTPYSLSPAVAVSSNGVFVATPDDPSIREFSWTGELRRSLRLLEPVNTVSEAELRLTIEEMFERQAAGGSPPSADLRRAFEQLEPPGFAPRFRSLVVDGEGWLWAETFQLSPDAPNTFLLFDPTGQGRGSVVTPRALSVVSISRDFVAGIWRDEFDVEYVRLHRVEGRP